MVTSTYIHTYIHALQKVRIHFSALYACVLIYVINVSRFVDKVPYIEYGLQRPVETIYLLMIQSPISKYIYIYSDCSYYFVWPRLTYKH